LMLPPEIPRNEGGGEAPVSHAGMAPPGSVTEQLACVGVEVAVGMAVCAIAELNPKTRPAARVNAPTDQCELISPP